MTKPKSGDEFAHIFSAEKSGNKGVEFCPEKRLIFSKKWKPPSGNHFLKLRQQMGVSPKRGLYGRAGANLQTGQIDDFEKVKKLWLALVKWTKLHGHFSRFSKTRKSKKTPG